MTCMISARSAIFSVMTARHYSTLDRLIDVLDTGLRSVFRAAPPTERANPADAQAEAELSEQDRDLAGRLMRINHAGEVSAQGLYQGQALTARLPAVCDKMQRAADEENDHLNWCASRIHDMGTHTSYLDPFWYAGSVAIGALAGIAGDKWSLGFVAEHQVVRHLDSHLARINPDDRKTRVILEQMREDEGKHATVALEAGGATLPTPIKGLMKLSSKVMTKAAYWI